MYLNDMPLGQRGSFAIVGVAEASRLFFGKDVSNVTLAEAATMAGVLQSPSAAVAIQQRGAMPRAPQRRAAGDGGCRDSSTQEMADRAMQEPLGVVQRALEAEAPYFVDYVDADARRRLPRADHHDHESGRRLHHAGSAPAARRPGRRARRTDDARQDAVAPQAEGTSGSGADCGRPADRRDPRDGRRPILQPVAATTARSPRGASPARSSSRSSTSRPSSRPPQKGDATSRPPTLVDDSPTTWEFDDQVWTPENYENEYDGLDHVPPGARALAQHRDGQGGRAGRLRARRRVLEDGCGSATPPKAYPSIALGVFEATPFEIATAYTMFPNLGDRAAAAPHRSGSTAAATT